MDINTVRENIAEDWASDLLVQEVCLKLFDYGQSIEVTPETISEFGFGDLRSIVGEKPTGIQLMKAIQYLCGDRSSVLVAVFTLQDGTHLSNEAAKAVIEGYKLSGYELFHPATGTKLEDPYKQVILKWHFQQLK